MKKVSNKKGFTLAELLIVVAIIAILVAIAIPVFGTAMDKAKLSADAANVRASLAEQIVNAMTADTFDGTVTVSKATLKASATNNSDLAYDETAHTITVAKTAGGTPSIVIPYDSDVTLGT